MLKILREIKYSLIMDALLSSEVNINNNSNFSNYYYYKNNKVKTNNSKSKRRVKIRK